ncbi:DNA polymerase III subunit beta [Frankia sp. AiPa1]|uniref:DNA polymerase III subunit beta family protein n=1 Tax=Frankia sp. AiPa1 TaxID=573492 RepID=UPI00202B58CF|nr:DNA polymerase III subunit beta [Frankia sp. AiPa1]MCL9758952.1 DNA polymerase III subunit beta [Frankia sp. AiPa1]
MTVIVPPAVAAAGATAIVPYGELFAALTVAGTVIDRKSPPPYNATLVTGDEEGGLTVTGASATATVTVRLSGVARSAGRFLVDGRALARMCTALVRGDRHRDTDDVPVLLDGSCPTTPVITVGAYSVPLNGSPTREHPGDCQPAPTIGTVERPAFLTALHRVLPAIGHDGTLPVLTGVHLTFTPGLATLAATDRYRLAIDHLPATTTGTGEQAMLLPATILAACATTWTGPSVTIGRTRDADRVNLTCGQSTLSLVETVGGFPPWHKVLRQFDAQHTATFDRTLVLGHVARVLAILAARRTTRGPITTLTLTPNGLQVAPLLPENDALVRAPTLPATTSVTKGTVRWAFNAAYLRDALAALPGDTVTFHGRSSTEAGVLFTSPDEQTASTVPYRHLLMPVRLP